MASFTNAQKAKAVQLYLEHGPDHAAAEIGCDRRSIYRWLGSHGVTSKTTDEQRAATALRHAEKRELLRELLLDQATDLIHRMNEQHKDYRGRDSNAVYWDKAPADATRAYATAAAILIDKYRLEMGEATARTYHEGSDDIDRSVSQLVEELGRRRQADPA